VKILSLSEFKVFCDKQGYTQYIYDTTNQSWKSKLFTYNEVSRYNKVQVLLYPYYYIGFKGQSSSICFKSVKYIRIHDEIIGTVFDIVCGVEHDPTREVVYTMIAD